MKLLLLLITLAISAVVAAGSPGFSWQPEDPASWDAKNKPEHAASPPSSAGDAASRWSAEGITRSLEQEKQRDKENQNRSIKANRERAARNPLCSDTLRDSISAQRGRPDYQRRQAQYSQICPPDSATFTLDP